MAEIEVREKYPQSLRLDHPNFGDVYRTVYAKGVITDFEKIQDNPLKVASRVKVDVEGYGESEDYLPLFYHPKAQYWDDEDHQAQDFNAVGKYFEQAWRSFRKGDEVAVMLRATKADPELKPFAAVGFVDGVPRIGEAIIRHEFSEFSGQQHFYHQKQGTNIPYSNYDVEQQGPDGNDLELELEAEIDGGDEEVLSEAWLYDGGDYYGLNETRYETSGSPIAGTCECVDYYLSEVWNYVKTWVGTKRLFFFIGPICFCFQFMWKRSEPTPFHQYIWDGCQWISGYVDYPPGNCEGNTIWVPHSRALGNWDQDNFLGYGNSQQHNIYTATKVTAAICSKEELLEILGKHSPKSPYQAAQAEIWWEEYSGFEAQSFVGAIPSGSPPYEETEIDYQTRTAFVRPHSKEELQEAGMWPIEEAG